MFVTLKKKIKKFIIIIKFAKRNNTFGKNIKVSSKLKIGKNCVIQDNVILGSDVHLQNNVHIGKNSVLEKIFIGNDTFVETGVICTGYGNGKIHIGNNSYIGINNILDWSNNIKIGNFVHIAGPSTGLWTHSSAKMCFYGIPLYNKNEEYRPTAPIVIEDNVYIGGNCTIYPGVTIHHHSIVAPNSAVTKDVPPYTLVGGVPAYHIKEIKKL